MKALIKRDEKRGSDELENVGQATLLSQRQLMLQGSKWQQGGQEGVK